MGICRTDLATIPGTKRLHWCFPEQRAKYLILEASNILNGRGSENETLSHTYRVKSYPEFVIYKSLSAVPS